MLVLIKIAFICYAAYWAWNKAVNKRDVFREAVSDPSSGTSRISVGRLQVEVMETTFGDVDDDGDVQCKVRVKVKNITDYDLSQVSLTTLIKTDGGVVLITSQDDEYEELKSGGSRTIKVDLGYLKFKNTLWGVHTAVKAIGFGAQPGVRQEIEFPKTFEGPFMVADNLATASGVTLRSVSGSIKQSDEDDETSEGTLSLRGIVEVARGSSVLGLEVKGSLKSSGGRHLAEDSSSLDRIALSGQPITWSFDIENVARLGGATLEFTSSLLTALAEGEGLGEGYEDATGDEDDNEVNEDDDDVLSASEDDDNEDDSSDEDEDEALENDDDSSDDDEAYKSDDVEETDSDDESEDESKVAMFALQIQSVQSFSFASRSDSPKPASIEAIKADFERIELTLYPELPCQYSVDGLTVRDVQVAENRVERRYEARINISATEEEYEKVKALLTDEGFLKGGVSNWTGAIASFIWDTNKAPAYADFSGEQRSISLVTSWDLEVDGEEKRPQIGAESRKASGKEQGSDRSRESSARADKGSPKTVDITAYVRSVQQFSFYAEENGAQPTRSRIERDFKEISCELDPKPPGRCDITDLQVEDVEVSKNGVTRVFTCVVHVSATGEQLKALHKLMAEEHYLNGGDIDWGNAIGAFLSKCYECPDYACFREERVTVDTNQLEAQIDVRYSSALEG
jgi:hypothetical protein